MENANPVEAGRKETPPMLKLLTNETETEEESAVPTLDTLARAGAQQMLETALQAEVAAYIDRHGHERDANGHAVVVRNGRASERHVICGAGTLTVQAPRVNDKRVDADGVRQKYTSKILPPYMRKSPKLAEVLPVLYLRGLSSGDFSEALPVLLGKDAKGLSASVITRTTAAWDEEYKDFKKRDLSAKDYVYVWVDGVHFNIRLEEDRLCTLVVIGVQLDGTKELIAVEDGYRESTESWLSVLRDLHGRGMRAPALAIGDGALGFWAALREVWPATDEQRCWFHRLGNVLDKLPKRLEPKAKNMLHEIMNAETRTDANTGIAKFAAQFKDKYPKAVKSLRRDEDKLLTFFRYPAEHWRHLRTTNVVESPFATVRLRQRITKGAGTRARGLMMAFKLLDMAQKRWRKINGATALPLVRTDAVFEDGILINSENQQREIAA